MEKVTLNAIANIKIIGELIETVNSKIDLDIALEKAAKDRLIIIVDEDKNFMASSYVGKYSDRIIYPAQVIQTDSLILDNCEFVPVVKPQ